MVNLNDYKPRDASKGYNWIKIRTSLLDDPKYMRLSDLAKVMFFELYLLAGKSDAGGLILAGDDPVMVQDLAWILRKPDTEIQNALDELQRAGFVNLDDDQVTVCKFANEQGPDASEKRKQWALRQAKRRALAKGEVWIEPDAEQNQNQEPEKEKNTEPDQDQEQIKNQTKTKRVTHTSRDNHAVVTRDSIDDDVLAFGDDVLDVWRELKGSDYKPSQKFWQMIQDWHEAGVTQKQAKWALMQTVKQAQTPLYVRELAVTMRDDDPEVQNQKNLEKFRQLYRQSKNQAGGDNDVHE
jgi:hypothetical protein